MRPKTLRARMFAWFAALAAFLVCSMFAAFWFETRRTTLESLDAELRTRARDVHARLSSGTPAAEIVSTIRGERRLRGVAIVTPKGMTEVARAGSLRRFAATIPAERLVSLAAQPRRERADTVDVRTGKRLRVSATAFPHDIQAEGAVVVAAAEDLASVDDELDEVLAGFVISLPVALGVSFWGAWLAARRLTKPLREIAEAADRIEFGGEEVAIPGTGAADEVGRLAGTLERTFARLREAYARQERFSADAAHELRTPVSIVVSQAEVALRRERTSEEYRESLGHVLAAARRMQETVDSLIVLARGSAGELSLRGARADLADVCRRVLPDLEALASARGVAVAVETDGASVVAGDASLLAMLVRNVAVNAVDHSPAQTTVRIGVAATPAEIVLRVRDEGPGIPPDLRERVFDRFFRADGSRSRATGGSGLGLSLVRLIAQIHGGTASVVDAGGPGACVEVRLPRAPG